MKLILPPAVANPAALLEQARLDALASYDVLDTPPEETFDRLTRLARRVFNVPMSTVTFIDGHRQWFKSQQGMTACETDREPAFCNIAIQLPDALIVPDAAIDERFSGNPFVRGEPYIRFYAGVQLRSPDGHAIGTLCTIDTRPRSFSADHSAILAEMGGIATDLLELRRQVSLAKRGSRPRSGDAHAVMKAGRLVFNRGKTSLRCTVRSLSPAGAAVDVMSTAGIPDRVALLIDSDATSRLCDIAAKAEQRLELSFES
ncbi:GAF domain-containing protein [Bosea vaviloviae]|uniref:GAF domain-containing protein n=1 Tax=Bosea vaviloviae TaxID=1526658 RepID=UPI001FCDA46B|nr:GAF domain-containing protein [Bosea vaviloviae]